jgi:hypothetical protein
MKELITLFTIIFGISIQSFGQTKIALDSITGKVVYREVIELDTTYKAEKIFSLAKEWLSTNTKNFNRSNSDKNFDFWTMVSGNVKSNSSKVDILYKNDQPLKYHDFNEKKVIGKGMLKYSETGRGCLHIFYFEYDIRVLIKDYKCKIEITNFTYTHYNSVTMNQIQIYGLKDQGYCSSKGTIENLIKCEKCPNEFDKLYTYLTIDMTRLKVDLKFFLQANKKTDDKW